MRSLTIIRRVVIWICVETQFIVENGHGNGINKKNYMGRNDMLAGVFLPRL